MPGSREEGKGDELPTEPPEYHKPPPVFGLNAPGDNHAARF
jgi:hypothetical protein